MSDQEKSPWEKVLNEISSPWDWTAMAAGAAVGAAVTITMGAADLGTAMSVGATVGIATRKAISASLQRPRLRRRAVGLKTELTETNHPSMKVLIDQLDREQRLWERKAIHDDEFSKQIDELISSYRRITEQSLIDS